MRKARLALILAVAAVWRLVCADTPGSDSFRYHLGRPATDADIAAAGISVGPDGSGLPAGGATARDGRPLYQSICASCHGLRGQGNGTYPALTGGQNTLTSAHPILTIGSYWPYATTVWDYLNRAMPYQNPGTLTSQQVYALTAYLLYLNKIVGERQMVDQHTLPLIRMPNRNGFTADPRPDIPEKRHAVTAQQSR
ncbi:MAG TPA: cytochrome c [Steroidobacteraceae bacterium]|jgi:cytochrome c|nr:cytochrome c [Steroidobacteraceae bacterium]